MFVNQKKLGPLHDDVPPFTFVLGTVGEGDFFFTPNKFWQGLVIRIFGLYFLGTLGDALI